MKSFSLSVVIVAAVFLNTAIAEEIEAVTSASGAYDGKILSSSACDLSEGDKRSCHNLTIKLNSGKVIQAPIWGGAIEIYNNKGAIIYKYNQSDSQAEMGNKFYSALGKLKKKANVWVDISCGSNDRCNINKIRLK